MPIFINWPYILVSVTYFQGHIVINVIFIKSKWKLLFSKLKHNCAWFTVLRADVLTIIFAHLIIKCLICTYMYRDIYLCSKITYFPVMPGYYNKYKINTVGSWDQDIRWTCRTVCHKPNCHYFLGHIITSGRFDILLSTSSHFNSELLHFHKIYEHVIIT